MRENNCRHSEGCLSERGLDLFDGLRGLDHAISHKEADLVIAGAAAYRRNIHSGLRDLLTSTAPLSPGSGSCVMGSVIYVLAQDDRIFSLKDFKRQDSRYE